jgi:hypothetical protein
MSNIPTPEIGKSKILIQQANDLGMPIINFTYPSHFTKYTLICGNPVDGFELYGLFDTSDDAIEWANKDPDIPESWNVIGINNVDDLALPDTQTE